MTAKLNDVDPLAWLADVLARIAACRKSGSMSCCHGDGSSPACKRRRKHGGNRLRRGLRQTVTLRLHHKVE